MIFMDKKKRDIVFDDTRTREEFFQTVSQIKHIHKSEKDVKTVSVSLMKEFLSLCVYGRTSVRACVRTHYKRLVSPPLSPPFTTILSPFQWTR